MVTATLFGGLANQLFQSAAVLGLSLKHGMDYRLPTHTTNPRWKHYRFGRLKYEDLDTSGFLHFNEPSIFYNQRPYNIRYQEIPPHANICLNGHFLSERFMEGHLGEIVPQFALKWPYNRNHISCHVRTGDYRKMQEYLPVMPISYFQSAVLKAVTETGITNLLVFGDDPDYNRQNFTKEAFPHVENIEFSEGKNEVEDLELISGCPVNICSNSTYSIWGHILNQHPYKMCIAPKNYYGPAYGVVDTSHLWPENTIFI